MSPHLSVYGLTLTMALSITHRITGMALYAGTLLLVVWLVALSTNARDYQTVAVLMNSFPGRLVLFAYTWVLFQHMLGGVRHFVWDTGHGFEHPSREWLARANVAGALLLTVIVWAVALLR